jgi:hypothetical protein
MRLSRFTQYGPTSSITMFVSPPRDFMCASEVLVHVYSIMIRASERQCSLGRRVLSQSSRHPSILRNHFRSIPSSCASQGKT